jgi:hypothetical protein
VSILVQIIFGFLIFAALLFYGWLDGYWDWSRPEKGALDLDVEAERKPTISTSTDINFIEGKPK